MKKFLLVLMSVSLILSFCSCSNIIEAVSDGIYEGLNYNMDKVEVESVPEREVSSSEEKVIEEYDEPKISGYTFDCGLYTLKLNGGEWLYSTNSKQMSKEYGYRLNAFFYTQNTNDYWEDIIISYEDLSDTDYYFVNYVASAQNQIENDETAKNKKFESCQFDGYDAFRMEYDFEYAGFDVHSIHFLIDVNGVIYNISFYGDKEDIKESEPSAMKVIESISFAKA